MSPHVRALLSTLPPGQRARLLEHLQRQREQRQRDQRASAGLPSTEWAGTHRAPTVFR